MKSQYIRFSAFWLLVTTLAFAWYGTCMDLYYGMPGTIRGLPLLESVPQSFLYSQAISDSARAFPHISLPTCLLVFSANCWFLKRVWWKRAHLLLHLTARASISMFVFALPCFYIMSVLPVVRAISERLRC